MLRNDGERDFRVVAFRKDSSMNRFRTSAAAVLGATALAAAMTATPAQAMHTNADAANTARIVESYFGS